MLSISCEVWITEFIYKIKHICDKTCGPDVDVLDVDGEARAHEIVQIIVDISIAIDVAVNLYVDECRSTIVNTIYRIYSMVNHHWWCHNVIQHIILYTDILYTDSVLLNQYHWWISQRLIDISSILSG